MLNTSVQRNEIGMETRLLEMRKVDAAIIHMSTFQVMSNNSLLPLLVRMIIPSSTFPLKSTFCSSLNFSIDSFDEKFISLDTALHFNIFFGTRAV